MFSADYQLKSHPRIFVSRDSLTTLASRSQAELSQEYSRIKAVADRALIEGIARPRGRHQPPIDLICAGISYMVERELGREADKYAAVVKDYWGTGQVLGLEGDGYFGYHGMVFDWIHDALSSEQRRQLGDQLGEWLYWYTDRPVITLMNGHWRYNQTWGPAHLNTPNTRDGIAPKLFVALAIAGSGTIHEKAARSFLDSWAERVPSECIPAFDEMGGVWSESMGHGGYGPVVVIPWAFEAWRTATGQDLFQKGADDSYLPAMTSWAVFLTVPFSDRTAWIDDNRASNLARFAMVAPILGARYKDPVANWISQKSFDGGWNEVPWNRFLSLDPSVSVAPPWELDYPLAKLFGGAGHVYMLQEWDNPNATWAFFGAGPKFAGHSRDDEGHFLIARKGWLALRAGGYGHNDRDYYAGGSLAFNILTIYDPDEEFRRTDPGNPRGSKNENDGGLIRYVYTSHDRDDRAEILDFHHTADYTYAAADLTQGYRANKVREVTRQFVYLRRPREFFIIFDRVEATDASFPKHWFLHVPTEPEVEGRETVVVPEHVYSYEGQLAASWRSGPAGESGLLSSGNSCAYLTSLLPENATLVKRGGDGHEFWGHPEEPTAQYNHVGARSKRPPVVPWRLETKAPSSRNRDYFLHVIELSDSCSGPTPVGLLKEEGSLGVKIAGEKALEVSFASEGRLRVEVRSSGSQ